MRSFAVCLPTRWSRRIGSHGRARECANSSRRHRWISVLTSSGTGTRTMPNEKIECFLDSNVLLYAASERSRDPRRHDIAQDLVLGTLFGVSGQTLAEFANVARR